MACRLHDKNKGGLNKGHGKFNTYTKGAQRAKWNYKYHIVFALKNRRLIPYSKLREEIGKILRDLCEKKGVEIIETLVCPDHVHMLAKILPKTSVSAFIGYLKGKSTLIIFERHEKLKYKYGQRKFWCRGYYVDTARKNDKIIKEYIRNQLEEDKLYFAYLFTSTI